MPAAFTLRKAVPADVASVLRLIRALAEYERLAHEVTASEADIHRLLFGDNALTHAVLAEVAGQQVGLALFYYTVNTFKAGKNMFLEDLFVEPVHRGSGIGLALMRHLARRAVDEGCRLIEWRVLNWNQPSIDFYERLGARKIEAWQTRQLGGAALAALAKGLSDG